MSEPSPNAAGSDVATLAGDADTLSEVRTGRAALRRGELVGRYVVLEQLGAGGMSVVYRAYDPDLDRVVALKLLQTRGDLGFSEEGQTRLVREAQAMARVSHPNVIVVHDVGTLGKQVFVAMEYIEGTTLRQWLKQHDRHWRAVLKIFLLAGEGLDAAHRADLVHRDFKPDNVLVGGRDGSVNKLRVTDFGLVQLAGRTHTEKSESESGAAGYVLDLALTQTGALVGTPAYMSPEQLGGQVATTRSDQFSFSVALYEALYRRRPFEGASIAELGAQIALGSAREPPSDSPVPAWVRRTVSRGLEREPEARFESMQAMLAELRRDPTRWRKPAALGVGALVVAVGTGALGAALLGPDDERCQGAATHTEEVWSDAEREEIRETFDASELPFASKATEEVTARFDGYATAWVELHTTTCLATARGEQSPQLLDLRMSCLRDRLDHLRAAVDVLREADVGTVRHAVSVASQLPPVARCADADALRAEVTPPEDPDNLAIFDELRARLAVARALANAGKVAAAQDAFDTIASDAREADLRPILAEALMLAGDASDRMSDNAKSKAQSQEAYDLALETGRERIAASAAATMLTVVGIRGGDWEAAEVWARTGMALARRIGAGDVPEADMFSILAERDRLLADLEAAEAKASRALEIVRDVTGERSPRTADALEHLAAIRSQRGSTDSAVELAERSLEIRIDMLGEKHPDAARGHAVMAMALFRALRLEEALEHSRLALEIHTQTYGRQSMQVASTLANMGGTEYRRGHLEAALPPLEESLSIYEAIRGTDHPKTAGVLEQLANVNDGLERADVALAQYDRALAVFREHYGSDHLRTASVVHNIGDNLLRRGRFAEALPRFEESMAVMERVLGPDHSDIAVSLTAKAEALVGLGRPKEAIPLAQRALDIRTSRPTLPDNVLHSQQVLTQALLDAAR